MESKSILNNKELSLTEELKNHYDFTFSSGAKLYLTLQEAKDYTARTGSWIVKQEGF